MKVLFINSKEPKCGVHQYGVSLFQVLADYASTGSEHQIVHAYFDSESELRAFWSEFRPDVVLYNWQAGIGGWMSDAPFAGLGRQVLVYHDLSARFQDFDAILFSDPTVIPSGNWHSIGRPLRQFAARELPELDRTTIGINGFVGAWASIAVSAILSEFNQCHIRLHLPFAAYGDSSGEMARASAIQCRSILPAGVTCEVNHDFMEWDDLMVWLSGNHVNCYLRDPSVHWRGVSSSLDAAMCAGRPIAINKCNAFRHMWDCIPSIMVEDRSIGDIIESGLTPLVGKYREYDRVRVAERVMDILKKL